MAHWEKLSKPVRAHYAENPLKKAQQIPYRSILANVKAWRQYLCLFSTFFFKAPFRKVKPPRLLFFSLVFSSDSGSYI